MYCEDSVGGNDGRGEKCVQELCGVNLLHDSNVEIPRRRDGREYDVQCVIGKLLMCVGNWCKSFSTVFGAFSSSTGV
jgi:hypothetical protein